MNLPKYGYYFTIPLTQNKETIVSEKDWYTFSKVKWYAQFMTSTKSFYAARGVRSAGKKKCYYLAREILSCKHGDGTIVDHINNNSLDNRRQNLRFSSIRKNGENRKDQAHHGAGIYKIGKKFRARAQLNGKIYHLGMYNTAQEAFTIRNKFLKDNGVS